jgi:hypothetical protein
LRYRVAVTLYLVEFRIEKSEENQNQYTEEGKCPEGEIPEYPERAPYFKVDVSVKKPDAPGNKKYQP